MKNLLAAASIGAVIYYTGFTKGKAPIPWSRQWKYIDEIKPKSHRKFIDICALGVPPGKVIVTGGWHY